MSKENEKVLVSEEVKRAVLLERPEEPRVLLLDQQMMSGAPPVVSRVEFRACSISIREQNGDVVISWYNQGAVGKLLAPKVRTHCW